MKSYAVFLVLFTLANHYCSASKDKPICGGTNSSKKIYLTNPKRPPRECVYTIKPYSNSVCQLRIDLDYTLAPPSIPNDNNGLKYVQCDKDYFQAGDLMLCGTETSQHIYLPLNRTAGVKSVNLIVALANRVGENYDLPTPTWNIVVKQLECPEVAGVRSVNDSFFVAPSGCLQYFPYPQGIFRSFNFDEGRGLYPGKLNYAICFRRTDKTRALSLTSRYFNLGTTVQCNGYNCDYLLIPQSNKYEFGKRATYFCDNRLQSEEVISTNPGPLMIIFNSDGKTTQIAGFEFKYNLVTI